VDVGATVELAVASRTLFSLTDDGASDHHEGDVASHEHDRDLERRVRNHRQTRGEGRERQIDDGVEESCGEEKAEHVSARIGAKMRSREPPFPQVSASAGRLPSLPAWS
jgi:hypothetical protein